MAILGGAVLSSQAPPIVIAIANVPSRLDELLKHFPIFTDMEPLMSNMNDLFSTTQQILEEVDSNLEQSFITRIYFGILNNTIKAIMHMKEYIAMQTAEVVRNVLFFPCYAFLFPILHLTLVYIRL